MIVDKMTKEKMTVYKYKHKLAVFKMTTNNKI
jgi:hypothetical protein